MSVTAIGQIKEEAVRVLDPLMDHVVEEFLKAFSTTMSEKDTKAWEELDPSSKQAIAMVYIAGRAMERMFASANEGEIKELMQFLVLITGRYLVTSMAMHDLDPDETRH